MEIIALLTGFVKPVIDGFFTWREGENEMKITRMQYEYMMKSLEGELQLKLHEEMRKPESEFRQFVLDYEGKASEQTPFIRNLRASVRPVITYWSVILLTVIMFGAVKGRTIGANLKEMPPEIWWIFLAIFGFWFGGRAAMQVAETWKKGDIKKEEAKQKGEVSKVEIESKKHTTLAEIEKREASLRDFTEEEKKRAFGNKADDFEFENF